MARNVSGSGAEYVGEDAATLEGGESVAKGDSLPSSVSEELEALLMVVGTKLTTSIHR